MIDRPGTLCVSAEESLAMHSGCSSVSCPAIILCTFMDTWTHHGEDGEGNTLGGATINSRLLFRRSDQLVLLYKVSYIV